MKPFARPTALILPLVLLATVVLEQVAVYKIRQWVPDTYLRTAIILVFYGVGFAFAVEILSPWLVRLLRRVRRSSKREAGSIGLWIFYAFAYLGMFHVYRLIELHDIQIILPVAWQ